MGELENILKVESLAGLKTAAAQAEQSAQLSQYIFDELDRLNRLLSSHNLGSKLFETIKAHSSALSTDEVVKLIDVAMMRLMLHTNAGKYTSEYKGIDDQVYELPGKIAKLKKDPDFEEKDSSVIGVFLDYAKNAHRDKQIGEFNDWYHRFIAIRDFYQTVPQEFRDLPRLKHERADDDWEKLKSILPVETNPAHVVYHQWIDKFASVERDTRTDINEIRPYVLQVIKEPSGPKAAHK
jgi:hypothetical protein